MTQYIHGYIADHLDAVGNIDVPLNDERGDAGMAELEAAFRNVERLVERVPLAARLWDTSIALKDPDNEKKPVIVLGVVYQQGEEVPAIPSALEGIFPGETPVELPLKYQKETGRR
ncbi:hypothetical protein FHETE_1167 [Fusarium heterosporum]|uniref:Uncharacterized protein n=1 Tax=Fusarium heterosporum TaxID=42747 RepID=A0A8H5TZY2_FUSHE|nr:hypothetical protein FHETE_1167 [Fusarium heterosporum]